MTKLNEFRTAVVAALNELTATEAENVAEHELRVAALDAEFAEFQRTVANITVDLNAVAGKCFIILYFFR